jgi:hypothetical protein
MWSNFFEIGRILSQVWPEDLAVIWQQWGTAKKAFQ